MKEKASRHNAKVIFIVSMLVLTMVMLYGLKPPTRFCAVYVHPDWNLPVDQTSESTFERMAKFGINAVFVDIYYPTGNGEGKFLAEEKGPWLGMSRAPEFLGAFSLEQTIERAKKHSIALYVTVSCFGELPAIDPTNEAHRGHLLEVVEYILTYFPSVSGIQLDYIRYMHEWGLQANGNTIPIRTLVRSIREIVRAKMLSAVVYAVANQDEYNIARNLTGQDLKELSQYLDFMCPMAYHLSGGKDLEWIRQVTRFLLGITQKECRVYPIVQAYYQFETNIVVSDETIPANGSISGPTLNVPSYGMLRFETIWKNSKHRFSLNVRAPSSQEFSVNQSVTHLLWSTGEVFTVNASILGLWTSELKAGSASENDDSVTVHISDVDEEMPGYNTLRAAVTLVLSETGGVCVYALNNLSPNELSAIRNALDEHVNSTRVISTSTVVASLP